MRLYQTKAAKRSPFAGYACLYFSHHLRRSPPDDVQRFSTLSTFFGSNVCCWIEFVAHASAISTLIRTAKDVKGFLQARTKYYALVGKEVQRVENWHQDLIRLATQFGQNLIDCPSSIFWLIPPLCPSRTAIGAQFGKEKQGMTGSRLSSTWLEANVMCDKSLSDLPRVALLARNGASAMDCVKALGCGGRGRERLCVA